MFNFSLPLYLPTAFFQKSLSCVHEFLVLPQNCYKGKIHIHGGCQARIPFHWLSSWFCLDATMLLISLTLLRNYWNYCLLTRSYPCYTHVNFKSDGCKNYQQPVEKIEMTTLKKIILHFILFYMQFTVTRIHPGFLTFRWLQ